MSKQNHRFIKARYSKEEKEDLHVAVMESIADNCDVLIIIGGMGNGVRNVTVPVIKKYLDSDFPGFGEFFRVYISKAMGLKAIFYRALAGTIRNMYVFTIPSEKVIVDITMEKIISKISGIINEVNN